MSAVSKYSFEEAKFKLEALCAYQERCVSELIKKLTQWGIKQEDQKRLILGLKEDNFLNEKRFAIAFASGRSKIKRWGRNKIVLELKKRKISEDDIRQAISEIDDELYLDNIKSLVAKKIGAITKGSEYEKRMNTLRYMYNKGYEADLVNEVIDDWFTEHKL